MAREKERDEYVKLKIRTLEAKEIVKGNKLC